MEKLMELKLSALTEKAITEAYNSGMSLNAIARAFHTYPTTIKRLLEKNDVELRHDTVTKGCVWVKDGEKLIEWAKAQGRPVTKDELAKVIGKKKLSPSYFIKYPELSQYIKIRGQKELEEYYEKLYKLLKDNHIPYKPNDKARTGVSVDALLLGEYKGNTALQIRIKPNCVSTKNFYQSMNKKLEKAKIAGVGLIFIDEDDFDKNLETIKDLLASLTK